MDCNHWDRVYSRPTEELGWHEPAPSTLPFVTAHSTSDDSVIDIGGGDSSLVDALLDRGHADVTVLDVSAIALERCRTRLGDRAVGVSWIHADVVDLEPGRSWDLWHDRATFHFLADPAERRSYVETARRAVAAGGRIVIAVFAPDGPAECAGLPVRRYDAESLAAEFGKEFALVDEGRIAPAEGPGDRRPYTVAVLERT